MGRWDTTFQLIMWEKHKNQCFFVKRQHKYFSTNLLFGFFSPNSFSKMDIQFPSLSSIPIYNVHKIYTFKDLFPTNMANTGSNIELTGLEEVTNGTGGGGDDDDDDAP